MSEFLWCGPHYNGAKQCTIITNGDRAFALLASKDNAKGMTHVSKLGMCMVGCLLLEWYCLIIVSHLKQELTLHVSLETMIL